MLPKITCSGDEAGVWAGAKVERELVRPMALGAQVIAEEVARLEAKREEGSSSQCFETGMPGWR